MRSIYQRLENTKLSNLNSLELAKLLEYSTESILSAQNHSQLILAIDLATVLHSNQTRKTRNKLENVPYIEHVLRNTLRLLRWGIDDINILISSLLHDTIEDTSHEYTERFLQKDIQSDEIARKLFIQYLHYHFNDTIVQTIQNVTNPLSMNALQGASKRETYIAHVKQAIHESPATFFVKLSDYVDNAGALWYDPNDEFVKRQSKKYLPLIDEFINELHRINQLQLLSLTEIDTLTIESQLQYIKLELEKFQEIA